MSFKMQNINTELYCCCLLTAHTWQHFMRPFWKGLILLSFQKKITTENMSWNLRLFFPVANPSDFTKKSRTVCSPHLPTRTQLLSSIKAQRASVLFCPLWGNLILSETGRPVGPNGRNKGQCNFTDIILLMRRSTDGEVRGREGGCRAMPCAPMKGNFSCYIRTPSVVGMKRTFEIEASDWGHPWAQWHEQYRESGWVGGGSPKCTDTEGSNRVRWLCASSHLEAWGLVVCLQGAEKRVDVGREM